ncbi:MAG: nuclear transport factor 2 family protein [Verrucomicrobiota bacterium]|jgi:ketosteroid isomerase-like protein
MQPEPNPITGREAIEHLATPLRALVHFYLAFNSRNLNGMRQNWLQSPEITMDNPVGGVKRGWQEIESIYRKLFQGEHRVEVQFHDYSLHVADSVFYAIGRERGTLYQPDGTSLALAIRTTRIFRRVDNTWKQVHHHGSIDDPEVLRHYQLAVLKQSVA